MNLDEMWNRLAQHQPYANQRGYGEAWERMCKARTPDAAAAVEWAAAEAGEAAARAADAAWVAARAAEAVEAAWADAEAAIKWIEKAEGRE